MSTATAMMIERFKALNSRERNIVLILVIAVVVVLWDTLLFAPIQRETKQVKQQINALNSKINAQKKQLAELVAAANQDPNSELKERRDQLSRAVARMDQRLQALTSNLIPPEQMAEVLEQVLRQNSDLKLIRVTSLPTKKLTGEKTGSGIEIATPEETEALYRHGVRLELEGNYFDTLNYLQKLEALPWQVLWSSLQYEVKEYPRAAIRLEINTLSTDAGWIGV